MTVYIDAVAPSGGSYAATVERLVDGYHRQDDAETFSSGLVLADKDITLTEGSDEDRGSYTRTLDASTWNDGLYLVRIHDVNDNHAVVGAKEFRVKDGSEVVDHVDVPDIYHADILYIVDSTNTKDEYTVSWFKNGVPVASGITSPTIQVIRRTDGTDLVAASGMSQIGSTEKKTN